MKINYFLALLISLTALCDALVKPQPMQAQNNFVLWGVGRDSTLGYTIRSNRTNARLNTINFFAKLPKSKAIAEIQILYPEGFGSIFNPENIRIVDRNTRNEIKVKETTIDRDLLAVRFLFDLPIAVRGNSEIEIISSGGSNPSRTGSYRVELQAIGTEANPLFQYVGQWLVSID